jgi:poly(A) polymerase
MLERTASWVSPIFSLTGEDVKELGIEPGPRIGELLALVENWWESSGYVANRQLCLDRLFKEANRQ